MAPEAGHGAKRGAAADTGLARDLEQPLPEQALAVPLVLVDVEAQEVAIHDRPFQAGTRNQRTVRMPSAVSVSEPARCAPMAAIAQPTCDCESRPTTSAENVENVVRPPRKPVITKSRASGGSDERSGEVRDGDPDEVAAEKVRRERAQRHRREERVQERAQAPAQAGARGRRR